MNINVATFQNVTHVGEKVFGYLTKRDIDKCLKVCKNWNLILNQPIFWLNKWKNLGQSSQMTEQWLDLISKLEGLNVAKKEMSVSLKNEFLKMKNVEKQHQFFYGQVKKQFMDLISNFESSDTTLREVAKGLRNEYLKIITMTKDSQMFYVNRTIICVAIEHGLLELLKCFVESFDNPIVCYPNHAMVHPIVRAITSRQIKAAEFMLKNLKTPFSKMEKRQIHAVFEAASFTGNLEFMKMIIEQYGQNLNVRNSPGYTALFALAMNGRECRLEILKYLSQILNVNVCNQHTGDTPLDSAVRFQVINSVKILAPLTSKNYLRVIHDTSEEIKEIIMTEKEKRLPILPSNKKPKLNFKGNFHRK